GARAAREEARPRRDEDLRGPAGRAWLQPPRRPAHPRARRYARAARLVESNLDAVRLDAPALPRRGHGRVAAPLSAGFPRRDPRRAGTARARCAVREERAR